MQSAKYVLAPYLHKVRAGVLAAVHNLPSQGQQDANVDAVKGARTVDAHDVGRRAGWGASLHHVLQSQLASGQVHPGCSRLHCRRCRHLCKSRVQVGSKPCSQQASTDSSSPQEGQHLAACSGRAAPLAQGCSKARVHVVISKHRAAPGLRVVAALALKHLQACCSWRRSTCCIAAAAAG